jgi:hypothetical protein
MSPHWGTCFTFWIDVQSLMSWRDWRDESRGANLPILLCRCRRHGVIEAQDHVETGCRVTPTLRVKETIIIIQTLELVIKEHPFFHGLSDEHLDFITGCAKNVQIFIPVALDAVRVFLKGNFRARVRARVTTQG